MVSQNIKMGAPGPPNGNPEKTKGAGGRGRSPQDNIFQKRFGIFSSIIRSILGSPKINNIGFEGSRITKSKSYKFKLKQNNKTEPLSSFP